MEFDLKDLFLPESDWGRRLSDACLTELRKQEASSVVNGTIAGFKTEELGRFTVSATGVRLHFSPYHVGSYAEGAFTVQVPWTALKSCLRMDGPAGELVCTRSVKPRRFSNGSTVDTISSTG